MRRAIATTAAALLLLAAGGAQAATDRALDATWAGTWSTSRAWSWTFTQSGTTVTGVAAAVSYKFVGTVSGATLTGKEYGDNTLIAQCEYVKLTLGADGKTFSGYTGSSVTGPPGSAPACPPTSYGAPFTGKCIAGRCLDNTGALRDTQPPKVEALASSGTVGGSTSLRYLVQDNSGRTSEELTIYRSGLVARRYKTPLGPAKTGRIYAYKLEQTPASFRGTFRFCVQSRDAAGNASRESCAKVTIR